MTTLVETLSSDFLPRFLAGMAVNFEIAVISIVVGLALGALLAFGRLFGGSLGGLSASIIALMRAAPTFVVMFFLLNAIPRDAKLFGMPFALSGVMTVALSLVPYSAAYIADAAVDALRHLSSGARLGALLFLPNVTRAFFVLVMSSSAGAAIASRAVASGARRSLFRNMGDSRQERSRRTRSERQLRGLNGKTGTGTRGEGRAD